MSRKDRSKSETGNRYGRLLVTSRSANTKGGSARWTCICDCGNTVVVAGDTLRRGLQVSCGCYAKSAEKNSWKLKNLLGMTFGRLTVINRELVPSRNRPYWICECSCGNTKLASSACLLKGKTVSCGCKKIEECRQRTGPLNNLWNPSLTTDDRLEYRASGVIHLWRKAVKSRDNGVCCVCLEANKPTNAHHIIPWSKDKASRSDTNNGITMCVNCHKEYHKQHKGDINDASLLVFIEQKSMCETI